ncbi:MFS transporter [Porphyrobacter sp. GA68]|uniref:MFS transporter n=1 Tax=Porphyrobacter sp. GA68 TaxID=2883480 RepID=UPI001D189DCF|nr:MFS transporter [Porphyrobacter sp. GA68]
MAAATGTEGRPSEFRLGWRVLLASLIGISCGASPLPFNTIGFTLAPINAETGWSFAQISAGVLIYGVIASLLAPVFGWLADRYGVRPVTIVSMVLFGLAFASFALTPSNLFVFYGIWVLVGMVGIGSTPVTFSRAISMWFFRNRGLALGIALVGTSIAALIVPRVTVWAIEAYGWRTMYLIVAGFPLLVALPLILLWFREPRPEETPQENRTVGGQVTGVTLQAALRDRRFWTIWLSILCVALAYGGAHIHMPEIIKQHGMTAAEGAGIMGMIGIAIMAGRIITGFLLDRIWAPLVCLPILLVPALACWLLMGTGTNQTLIYTAAFMLGFAAGAESDLIAYLASRYFGMANYGKIYGMLYMPFGLGSAFSPVIYGWFRDTTGSYDGALTLAMGGFAVGALLLITLGRYPVFTEPDPGPEPVPKAVPA